MRTLDPAIMRGMLLHDRAVGVVTPSSGDLADVLVALRQGGVRLIEISLRGEGALELLERAKDLDGVVVGAGWVLDGGQAKDALDAGAAFLSSPAGASAVAGAIHRGVATVVAAQTPTEARAAERAGATAVAAWPPRAIGAEGIGALRSVLRTCPLVSTGDMCLDDAGSHLAAGADAVAVESALLGDALVGGSLAGLTARAAALRSRLSLA